MEQKINNAGFEIVEMTKVNERSGYAWGKSATQYVTWAFRTDRNGTPDFYYGNYFMIDPDSPARAEAACRANYYERLSAEFEVYAKYGY